jgi:DNA-directed RNA polymerase subunit RPC12/RpoP
MDTPTAPQQTADETIKCPECGGKGKIEYSTPVDDGGAGTLIGMISPTAGLIHEVGRERIYHADPCSTCGADGRISETQEGEILDRSNRQSMIMLAVAGTILLVAVAVMLLVGGLDAFSQAWEGPKL